MREVAEMAGKTVSITANSYNRRMRNNENVLSFNSILEELQIPPESVTYLDQAKSEYLIGVEKNFKAVDVEKEIHDLENYCKRKSIPFFGIVWMPLTIIRSKILFFMLQIRGL